MSPVQVACRSAPRTIRVTALPRFVVTMERSAEDTPARTCGAADGPAVACRQGRRQSAHRVLRGRVGCRGTWPRVPGPTPEGEPGTTEARREEDWQPEADIEDAAHVHRSETSPLRDNCGGRRIRWRYKNRSSGPTGAWSSCPRSTQRWKHRGSTTQDLAPVPIEKRTWTTYNYLALWVGMAINIPTWLLASGLIALGMAWYQAIFTIFLANVIVLIPMLAHQPRGHQVRHPVPGLRAGLVRRRRRQPAGADARRRGLRLVRHPDLDRRHGAVRRGRPRCSAPDSWWVTARQDLDRHRCRGLPAVDPVAQLRHLLGPQHRHRPAGHGGDQAASRTGRPRSSDRASSWAS